MGREHGQSRVRILGVPEVAITVAVSVPARISYELFASPLLTNMMTLYKLERSAPSSRECINDCTFSQMTTRGLISCGDEECIIIR